MGLGAMGHDDDSGVRRIRPGAVVDPPRFPPAAFRREGP